MASTVFDVENWKGKSYKEHDIVMYPARSYNFFYCIQDHVSQVGDIVSSSSYDSTKWTNGKILVNNVEQYYFHWTPSNNILLTQSLRNKIVSMDGYAQTVSDGINPNILQYQVNFNNRNTKEATAILHFLHQRKGSVPFIFLPPKPYRIYKGFTCKKWSCKSIFENIWDISANFVEWKPLSNELELV